MFTSLSRYTPHLQAALRIIAALLFLQHGLNKFIGWPPSQMPGPPSLLGIMGVAAAIETFGSLLLIVGLFTRPAAFLMSGMMAVAYFMAHAPRGFFPIGNGGEGAILYCFIFLFLAAAGPGAWALDNRRSRATASAL